MRKSESLNLIFFAFFLILAWLRPMTWRRRLEITAFGVAGGGLTFFGVALSQFLPSFTTILVRDLLPIPLMLFVYWQAGRFIVKPNEWIQKTLLRLDDKLIGPILRRRGERHSWLRSYLELSYLLCYPLIPLAVGVLNVLGKQQHTDRYWSIVLLSTYLCFLPLPFIQMLPPRMLEAGRGEKDHSDKLRTLNLGILKRASIQVNTFPSAHVASTIASSLALLYFAPVAGICFLAMALSVAGGAVLGRYHYAADAILGILFAGVVSLL